MDFSDEQNQSAQAILQAASQIFWSDETREKSI